MRALLRLLLVLLLTIPLLVVGLVILSLDRSPLIAGPAAITPAHIGRARSLLARNDPRHMRPGVLRTIVISREDLDLTVNYLANRFARGASEIVLLDRRATVRASFALPALALGAYLNLDASFRESQALPRVERLTIGSLPVPAILCNWLLDWGLKRLQANANLSAAADVVKQVRVRNGFLSVDFEWSEAVTAQLKAVLVDEQEQARWRAYQERLVELTRHQGGRRVMAFDQLLVPLLQLAATRGEGGAMAAENRAALIVLAFYITGKGPAALMPRAGEWPRAQRHIVTLAGRPDLSQHFSISAALAATAGGPLSDAVGLYKELDDARAGSGFSFNDIAAGRAGTRLGELAIAAGASARLQRAMAEGLREKDLMPDVRGLPEFLSAAEFKRRFGGVGQPAYQNMIAEIERRIAAMPLYR